MIPHSKPLITDEDVSSVSAVVAGGNLAAGKFNGQFERDMCSFIGIKNAVAVSSGTAALFCALKSLDVSCGGEVIIPSYVCSAALYAVQLTGAIPIVVDSGDEDIFHLDYKKVKDALTKKTKALIFPHMFGSANDLKDIISTGVPVIEDCAMSLGSEYGNIKTGNLGSVAAVYSFYATKVITTGEGGMIMSDTPSLIENIRDFISYADKKDDKPRFNFKMTDFAAALGLSQMKRLSAFIERRRAIAEKYSRSFSVCDFGIPREKENEKCIYYRYVLRTENFLKIRDRLRENEIFAERPVYLPLSRYDKTSASCPNAEKAWETTLSIPIYPAMSDEDVDRIIETVLDIAS